MTQTPIADDYAFINRRTKELTSPEKKWGIWNLNIEPPCWENGRHWFLYHLHPEPVLYTTKAEAEALIAEHTLDFPDYKAEAREYPGK